MTGRRNLSMHELQHIEWQTTDHGQKCHLPEEVARLDELFVEVLRHDYQRQQITGQTNQLGNDHQPVPRPYRQRQHQQLGENDCGEGDGDDMDEFVSEE